ncbi:sigma-70 family RNA polymerase sigma factor [Mesobacillus maritimus]|uniref:sigma-70 family RNA polymerase sigma factor n=1 Tax=Mesobacillus maritimus TaxID=1643336 RepID=UPI00203A478B|nr:sigma-70 family RNA polymerase sigma factor [Mesobacillus maritimus]MCM3670878.1 sigma-70 family RNA polymerase sigma factor [Mesobacillus maritimus]
MLELISRAQEGDDEAFLELFQTYENDLYRMAFVYVKNQEDALDVVQETAYNEFKNIGSLREPRYLKTWLLKIAISCATDLLRKNKKVVHLNPDYAEWIGKESGDVPLTITMQQILETLDEHEKSIVFMKYYQDYTFKEIADVKGMPLGSVKTMLYRALEKLRVQVKGADLI